MNSAIFESGGNLSSIAPPINNACLPTIYDKLDADARAKVKVINCMLDKQLHVRERIIQKYKDEALKLAKRTKSVAEKDLKRILRKYPNMDDMPFMPVRMQIIKNREQRSLGKFKAYSTVAIGMKGLSDVDSNDSFCGRYYGHHVVGQTRRLEPLSRPPEPLSRPLIMSKRLSSSDHLLHKFHRLKVLDGSFDDDAMTV